MAAARVVVIHEVIAQQALQVALVEHDDVVEQVPTDRADQAFDVRILPGRPRGDENFLDAQTFQFHPDFVAVTAVPVADQVRSY